MKENNLFKLKILSIVTILFFLISLFSMIFVYVDLYNNVDKKNALLLNEVIDKNLELEQKLSDYKENSTILDMEILIFQIKIDELNQSLENFESVSNIEIDNLHLSIDNKRSEISSLKSQINLIKNQLN